MPIYVPGKVTLRQTWQPMDADAAAYITAVETADGQALEERTKIAIDNFVLGCKADGIWSAIKASCILAGARTTNGALIPLVGTAPTPFNFDLVNNTDYNRKTGLKGDGSTKAINTNRASNADLQNNHHLSAYVTQDFGFGQYIVHAGGGNDVTAIYRLSSSNYFFFSRNASGALIATTVFPAFAGVTRSASDGFSATSGSNSLFSTSSSFTPSSSNYWVFAKSGGSEFGSGRLAFYSVGESINLVALRSRVTDLINAFGAAIP